MFMAGTDFIFRIRGDASGAVEATNKAGAGVKKLEGELKSLNTALNNLAVKLGLVFGLSQLIDFGKEIAKIGAEFDSLNRRFGALYEGAAQGASKMHQLQETTKELGLEFKSTAEQFYQFVAAAKASGMSIGQAERIFTQMTKAIAGSGASAVQAERAFVALTQMIGKGKIQSEELRGQLGEALPQAIAIMAKSLNVSVTELSKMADNGKLLSAEVLPAFANEMEKAFGPQAQTMAKGTTAEINRLFNAWEQYKASIGQRFSTSSRLGGLADLLEWWTKINESQEQYLQRQKLIMLDNSRVASLVRDYVSELREQGKSETEIVALLRQKSNVLLEGVKDDYTASAQDKIRQLNNVRAYREEAKLIEDAEIAKVESRKKSAAESDVLAQKERDKQMRLRAEQERVRDAEMDKIHKQALREAEAERLVESMLFGVGGGSKFTPDRRKDMETRLTLLQIQHEKGIVEERDYQQQRLQILSEYSDLDLQILLNYYTEASHLREKDNQDAQQKSDYEKSLLQQKLQYAAQIALSATQLLGSAYAKQEAQLNRSLAAQQITQEQYNQRMNSIRRKEFIMQKAEAISQIIINTAVQASGAKAVMLPWIIASGAAQVAVVAAQPIPYAKGTKAVKGGRKGVDSVHALLMPDERVVPTAINTTPGYRAMLDVIQDRRISPEMSSYLATIATGGGHSAPSTTIDYDEMGKSVAKYMPVVTVNATGAVELTVTEKRRRLSRL